MVPLAPALCVTFSVKQLGSSTKRQGGEFSACPEAYCNDILVKVCENAAPVFWKTCGADLCFSAQIQIQVVQPVNMRLWYGMVDGCAIFRECRLASRIIIK